MWLIKLFIGGEANAGEANTYRTGEMANMVRTVLS